MYARAHLLKGGLIQLLKKYSTNSGTIEFHFSLKREIA
jgi:hypothetical protein